jgi:hypothetical protein
VTGASRLADGLEWPGLEVVAMLSEHACYGLLGRVEDGKLTALQSHDLPIVEALVQGLDQPILRRGAIFPTANSSAAPSSPLRSSGTRTDPNSVLRRSF